MLHMYGLHTLKRAALPSKRWLLPPLVCSWSGKLPRVQLSGTDPAASWSQNEGITKGSCRASLLLML